MQELACIATQYMPIHVLCIGTCTPYTQWHVDVLWYVLAVYIEYILAWWYVLNTY